MRTSEEIYNRIRWDASLDAARFTIGLDVHGASLKRVAFSDFVAGGDIPWHRVVAFEADGVTVWDRRAGLDILDRTEAGRARAKLELQTFFEPRVVLASPEPTAMAPASNGELRVVTWNTLWDRYDADRLATERRRPHQLELLEGLDADLIALQEVELPLLELLLGAGWVRSRYHVGPSRDDVEQCGLVLLSRWPILELGYRDLGADGPRARKSHKALVAAVIEWGGAAPPRRVAFVALHLSSDHREQAREHRRRERELLASAIASLSSDVIVAGDFNDGDPELAASLGLADAWTSTERVFGDPRGDGATFDPTANTLAALSSLSGEARRLDRVLFTSRELTVKRAELAATEPIEPGAPPLFASDHGAVVADLAPLEARATLELPSTASTALAWLPPTEACAAIERTRALHDPQASRWPPHVNVVFGFVPESSFEAAARLLLDEARRVAPFDATLGEPAIFEHDKGAPTVHLPALPADRWRELTALLRAPLPACRARAESSPHLTLGRGELSAVAPVARAFTSQPLAVRELTFLSSRAGGPMESRARLELGPRARLTWLDERPGLCRAGLCRPSASTLRASVSATRVAEVIRAGLPDAGVFVTGSQALDCALADSDLDLVATGRDLDPHRVAESVSAALERSGLALREPPRHIVGARVPGLELSLASGLDVDLALVDCAPLAVSEAVARRLELAEPAALALSAVSDAEALAALFEREPHLRELARLVKRWARARGLDSAAFGTLPSLAWLVMVAATPGSNPRLEGFFAHWAGWDFREPVALERAVAAELTGVLTPTAPTRSMSAALPACGVATLTEELFEAWELASTGDVERLFTPPPLHRRHASWLVVTLRATRDGSVSQSLGWARGRALALLGALDRAGVARARAWPRPFEATRACVKLAIGLGDVSLLDRVTSARVLDAARAWATTVPGASVELAKNDAVPSLA
ncbi:MAG: RNA repair domain-containing protein [Polyangiaceae bacterium]